MCLYTEKHSRPGSKEWMRERKIIRASSNTNTRIEGRRWVCVHLKYIHIALCVAELNVQSRIMNSVSSSVKRIAVTVYEYNVRRNNFYGYR